jgi:HD superfamily phosphodiesterase
MDTPEWLFHIRKDLEKITGPVAAEIWPTPKGRPYFNYRLEHVRQVERDARWLLQQVGGDEEVVLAAVWLHDRFQPQ